MFCYWSKYIKFIAMCTDIGAFNSSEKEQETLDKEFTFTFLITFKLFYSGISYIQNQDRR